MKKPIFAGMSIKKNSASTTKFKLHSRNRHRDRYNFSELILSYPILEKYVKPNKYGDNSIDFSNPAAVKALNTALLMHFYGITSWYIPPNYLCPPIPGRADYIHHIADLLSETNNKKIPKGKQIRCLDIGIGANCIYPIIGVKEYGWSFVGAEIDAIAIKAAIRNIQENIRLKSKVEVRHQSNPKDVFFQIIQKGEQFDVSICNPPFHKSEKEALAGSIRKIKNLTKKKIKTPKLNFGGQANELWCEGGEKRFIKEMIRQSLKFSHNCYWFSTLVAKEVNVKPILKSLEKVKPFALKIIPMGQGNKVSRMVAWTFLNSKEQELWKNTRWEKIIS